VSWHCFCDYLEWGELIKKKKIQNKKETTVWIKAGRKRIKRLEGKEVQRMQMEGIFPLSGIPPSGKREKKEFDKLFKKFMQFPFLCLFICSPG